MGFNTDANATFYIYSIDYAVAYSGGRASIHVDLPNNVTDPTFFDDAAYTLADKLVSAGETNVTIQKSYLDPNNTFGVPNLPYPKPV